MLRLCLQKAVKEVFAYMEDLVMPEGLTLRPPDPDPPLGGYEEDNPLTNKTDDKQVTHT